MDKNMVISHLTKLHKHVEDTLMKRIEHLKARKEKNVEIINNLKKDQRYLEVMVDKIRKVNEKKVMQLTQKEIELQEER